MSLKGRNFLTLKDFTKDEIYEFLDLAAELKEKKKKGIFDRASMDIETLFDIEYTFSKGERLIYGDSAMNHAMVI